MSPASFRLFNSNLVIKNMNETSIYNYKLLSEGIATSGQPTENELRYISDAGYEVVINLGLHISEYSVNSEAAFFEKKKIRYIHIPVEFDNPQTAELDRFIQVLDKFKDNKVLVHCAANKRGSVFIALYRIFLLGWLADKAFKELNAGWQPNNIWQLFIDQQLLIRSS